MRLTLSDIQQDLARITDLAGRLNQEMPEAMRRASIDSRSVSRSPSAQPGGRPIGTHGDPVADTAIAHADGKIRDSVRDQTAAAARFHPRSTPVTGHAHSALQQLKPGAKRETPKARGCESCERITGPSGRPIFTPATRGALCDACRKWGERHEGAWPTEAALRERHRVR